MITKFSILKKYSADYKEEFSDFFIFINRPVSIHLSGLRVRV
jgi:hypothetical protein